MNREDIESSMLDTVKQVCRGLSIYLAGKLKSQLIDELMHEQEVGVDVASEFNWSKKTRSRTRQRTDSESSHEEKPDTEPLDTR